MASRKVTIRSGPRAGTVLEVEDKSPSAPGGTNDEGVVESVDEAVDRMSGSASNAGKQAQSSDASNGY